MRVGRWRTSLLATVLLTAACAFPGSETMTVEGVAGGADEAEVRMPVRVGLERLPEARVAVEAAGASEIADDVALLDHLAGKKLGAVVHAASVTADGRHAIDVFAASGLEIIRLFSPEHGLRGRAAAGEKVESGRDPVSGLPVVSLYGENRKPRVEDLAELDVLLFDLQGAGVRFYTYVSTLILTLEAAAENDVELIVLDRPNPLGGLRVEGPVAAPRDVVPASFVNLAPGPLVHGLTLGEMARVVNAEREAPARLEVVEMAGWQRSMTWLHTGRPWVWPSPNLRSAEAAIAYPGVAFLEATNVSEGRGTETPFLLFGAPFLADFDLALELPGFAFEPTRFTPTKSPAAPWAKHLDEECAGYRVRVPDPSVAEPYRLGLELATRLQGVDGFEWRRDGEALTWLLGTDTVYRALAAGRGVEEILAADAEDHADWRRRRDPHLLYPD